MATISEAKERMVKFFADELKKEGEAVRPMEVTKINEGWSGRIEVAEENLLLKKIGYPVCERNIYKVKMDEKLTILSYGQQGKEEKEEEK